MTRTTATLHVRDAEGKLREERRPVTVLGQGRDGCVIVMVDGERRARHIHAAWLDTLPLHTRPEPTERLSSDDARESRLRHNAERIAVLKERQREAGLDYAIERAHFAQLSRQEQCDRVLELGREGLGRAAIVARTGAPRTTVSNWLDGARPADVWSRHAPRARADKSLRGKA